MSLFDTISADIKSAMLARDKVRLEALRGVKKEFLEAKTAKGGDGELADDGLARSGGGADQDTVTLLDRLTSLQLEVIQRERETGGEFVEVAHGLSLIHI